MHTPDQSRAKYVTYVANLRMGPIRTENPWNAPITFDLRQEPGAGKPHAGICGGGIGQPTPLLLSFLTELATAFSSATG